MRFLFEYIDNQYGKKKNKALLCAFVFFFACLMSPQKSFSQVIDPVISFSVESCSLDVALEKLFAEYDVNVAFSKAELSQIRIPAYSCSYKPVDEVLRDLLKDTDYGYKKIGRQYVIKKMPVFVPVYPENHTNDPAVPAVVENHKVDTVLNRSTDTLRIFDTLFVTRILIQRDTVIKQNTVVEHDTTYIRKRNPVEFNWPSFRNNGWFANVSYEHAWGNLKQSLNNPDFEELYGLYNQSADLSCFAMNGVMAEAGYKQNRLSYGLSLLYRSLNYRFAMNRTVTEGNYYVNDTVDTYYVVNQVSGDTSFCYVLDSVFVPLETYNFSCREDNRLNYLGVGGFCSFDVFSAEYFRLFVKAGFSLDFLIDARGSMFSTDKPFYTNDLKDCAEKVKFNYSFGIGAALKVGERLELVPEVDYRGYAGSLCRKDYPIGLRMQSVVLKLGLTYYF